MQIARKAAPLRDSGVRPKKGRVLSLFCPKKPINGKKVLGNSVTEFSILELSGAKNPGIFCPLKKKILEFSWIFFLEFHENLVFPEFSGPRIFHPAIFCLEIFCPGILFPGKFWHSYKRVALEKMVHGLWTTGANCFRPGINTLYSSHKKEVQPTELKS